MTSPPTAALVDIGNVLVHLDFETALRSLIPPDADRPEERMRTIMVKKDELESGRIPDEEFVAWASQSLGFTGSITEFHAAWCSIFEPVPEMWSIIPLLKARGVRPILFSNIAETHANWLFTNYEVFTHFDGEVLSYQAGNIKPGSEIYHHAIARFGLTPSETLYIDDLPENIATGQRLGFRCHRYDKNNHRSFTSWLNRQLSE